MSRSENTAEYFRKRPITSYGFSSMTRLCGCLRTWLFVLACSRFFAKVRSILALSSITYWNEMRSRFVVSSCSEVAVADQFQTLRYCTSCITTSGKAESLSAAKHICISVVASTQPTWHLNTNSSFFKSNSLDWCAVKRLPCGMLCLISG